MPEHKYITRASAQMSLTKSRTPPSPFVPTDAKLLQLPQEILNTILEHLNGDTTIFSQISRTNKHFYEWAKSLAVKSWPVLQQQLRREGKRICERCMKILPVKQWVELGPRYWTYETFCVTCRIQEIAEMMYLPGSIDDYVKRGYEICPFLRLCLCCWCDYGTKRSTHVQKKMRKESAFCEHCDQRILLERERTQELAERCGIQYIESMARTGLISERE